MQSAAMYRLYSTCKNVYVSMMLVTALLLLLLLLSVQAVLGACRRSVDMLQKQWMLLLTGTPIQNNMSEVRIA